VAMLRSHLDGILAWPKIRLSNGAVVDMNNKYQLDQSPVLRMPQRLEFHRGHLSLLRPAGGGEVARRVLARTPARI
jgi:hypothetical protein